MADRSVVVRLRAEVAGFRQGMDEATRSTRRTRDEIVDADTAAGRLVQSANANREAWTTAGTVMVATGGAIAAGIGLAVKQFADFDAQMSQVKTLSHANARDMEQLTKAALTMGQAIGFSASQTADAETELVKAGLSVADIMGGALKGSLELAAAGQIDVAQATEIAASAMTQFKLTGKDVPHIADLLAAGADKALGSVGDLGTGLSSAGTVAAQFGWSLEETVGTLAEFAQNAQIGEKGGTLLRQMLLQLVNPSAQAQKIMDQYGFSISDANGQMVSSSELAGRLQSSFGDLTPAVKNHALAVLFGAHAIQGANILMSDGAKVNADWVTSVNDAGFAAQQAAGKMDNLKGDISKLKAALETDLIQAGSVANDTLRSMVQGVTGVAHAYGSLPEPLQGAALGLGAITSAGLLAGGGFLLLLPRALDTIKAFKQLNNIAPGAARSIATTGAKAAVAATAVLAFGTALNAATRQYVGAPASLEKTESALLSLGTTTTEVDKIIAGTSDNMVWKFSSLSDAAKQISDPSFVQRMSDVAGEIKGFITFDPQDGADGRDAFIKQLHTMGDALGQLVSDGHADVASQQFKQLSAEWVAGGGSAATLMKWMPGYSDALANVANKQQLATGSAGTLADGFVKAGGAASGATLDVKGFDSALKDLFDQTFGIESATDAWHSSLNDLAKAAKENGRSTKGNTDAAIANREALRTSAQKAYDLVQAYADTGASAEKVTAKSAALKAEFIKQAEKAGFSKEAAEHYADALHGIVGTYKANLKAVDGITPAVNTAKASLRSIQGKQAVVELNYRITTSGSSPYGASAAGIGVRTLPGSGVKKHKADGGFISGPGGPRDDKIPALLSNGEFVMNAASTAQNRPLLEHLNAQKFADGGMVGWAGLDSSFMASLGKDLGAQVVQAFADGMNGGKDSVKSVAQSIRTIIEDNAKKASDTLNGLLKDQASYASDVAGRFTSLGDLTGDPTQRGKSYTVGPDGQMVENTPSPFADQLTSAISQTDDFKATIQQLAKLGARTDILQQFLDKGPESAAAAAALAGLGRAGISNVNALQGQLVSASGSLGSLGASAVYGPRVSAARSSAADAKVLEVAVERATRGQVAELKKVTAEGRKTNAQLQRLAGELASALKGAGSGVQLAQRNKPAGR